MKFEKMDDNIITQIYNDKNLYKKEGLFDYIKQIYEQYINSINCKTGRESYKNVEDSRILDEEKVIKANEVGLCLNKEKILRVGSCNREVFFKLTGAIGELKEISEIEAIERINLVKEQWIRKLKLIDIYKEPEYKISEDFGIKVISSEDGFIYDADKKLSYTLIIKPVNDSAQIVNTRVFTGSKENKRNIMNDHIGEIILNLLILKQPVKIIYVGKNNSEKISEFNCGIENQKLIVNGEPRNDIDLVSVFKELKELEYSFLNNMVPPRSYEDYLCNQNDVANLLEAGLIGKWEVSKLLNGTEKYLNYRCKNCRYKNICNSSPKGWTSI